MRILAKVSCLVQYSKRFDGFVIPSPNMAHPETAGQIKREGTSLLLFFFVCSMQLRTLERKRWPCLGHRSIKRPRESCTKSNCDTPRKAPTLNLAATLGDKMFLSRSSPRRSHRRFRYGPTRIGTSKGACVTKPERSVMFTRTTAQMFCQTPVKGPHAEWKLVLSVSSRSAQREESAHRGARRCTR